VLVELVIIRALLHSWTVYPGEFGECVCVCVLFVWLEEVLSNCKKQV
jgi:hypothetical protein